MNKKNLSLYFVEGDNIVQANIEYEVYKQKIIIDDLQRLFVRFNFSMEQPYDDLYVYSNKNCDFHVDINSKENFYAEGVSEENIEDYLKRVTLIILDIQKALDGQDLEIIDVLMKTFNLNLYSKDYKKHFNNIHELRGFLGEQNLLKKS